MLAWSEMIRLRYSACTAAWLDDKIWGMYLLVSLACMSDVSLARFCCQICNSIFAHQTNTPDTFWRSIGHRFILPSPPPSKLLKIIFFWWLKINCKNWLVCWNLTHLLIRQGQSFLSSANEVSTGPTSQKVCVCLCFRSFCPALTKLALDLHVNFCLFVCLSVCLSVCVSFRSFFQGV